MKRMLHTVLSQTSSLVVVLDYEGTIGYASPAFEKLLGYTSSDLKGHNWWSLNSDSNKQKGIRTDILKFVNSNRSSMHNYEQEINNVYGGVKHVLWDAIKYDDSMIVGIGRDVSELRQVQRESNKLQEDMMGLLADLKGSLNYASRLQKAILKDPKELNKMFADGFVFYQPKDEVSGDIYWIETVGDYNFVAVIDCTGHGAPGALLSVVANTLLRSLIIKQGLTDPGQILTELDQDFIAYLNDNMIDGYIQDGMDMSLIAVNRLSGEVHYASANRPLFVVEKMNLVELKPDKYPIGYTHGQEKDFRSKQLFVDDETWIYLFTDGYPDQFGGERNKKFTRKRLKQTLIEVANRPGKEQRAYLDYTMKSWKQDEKQIDDITIVGVKVGTK